MGHSSQFPLCISPPLNLGLNGSTTPRSTRSNLSLAYFFASPKMTLVRILLENVYCFNDIQMCTSIDYHPPPNQDLNTVLYLIPTNTDVPSKYEIKTKEIGNNTNTPAAAAKY